MIVVLTASIIAKPGDALIIEHGQVSVITKSTLKELQRLKLTKTRPDYKDPDGPLRGIEERRAQLLEEIESNPTEATIPQLAVKLYGGNKYLVKSDIEQLVKLKSLKRKKQPNSRSYLYSIVTAKNGKRK